LSSSSPPRAATRRIPTIRPGAHCWIPVPARRCTATTTTEMIGRVVLSLLLSAMGGGEDAQTTTFGQNLEEESVTQGRNKPPMNVDSISVWGFPILIWTGRLSYSLMGNPRTKKVLRSI
jgi:hypothetical protein